MAVVVQIDAWEGAGLKTEGGIILEATRIAHVKGLGSGSWGSFTLPVWQGRAQGLVNAIGAWGLPGPWDSFPGMSFLRLVEYLPEPTGPNTCQVGLRYVNVGVQVINGNAALVSREANEDRHGTSIEVEFQPEGEPEPIRQGAMVQDTSANRSITFQRIEPTLILTSGIDPLAVQARYVDHINNQNWVLGPPDDTYEWLCESITFDSRGMLGIAWRMHYTFRHQRGGWNPLTVYVDPETGRPPKGIEQPGTPRTPGMRTNGTFIPDLKDQANFRELNLL